MKTKLKNTVTCHKKVESRNIMLSERSQKQENTYLGPRKTRITLESQ